MSLIGERRKRLPLNYPFAKAVETARRKALSRPDFDPAMFVIWGQMQAMGLLEMLKAVEERFGAEGQDLCRQAISRIGKQVAVEMLEGVEVPANLTDVEISSLFTTWINEVAYASIEEPSIDGPDQCSCDITYCPHEDTYRPFDCRIQRYFVEGMREGAAERLGQGRFDAFFDWSIPQNRETCHFTMKRKAADAGDAWRSYTEHLQQRALNRLQRQREQA